jgi:hypothetical protein
MPVYVVDTNFFIQAHRAIYPLDVAASFWNKIRQLAHAGTIISIDKVKDEIYDHQDVLQQWCGNNLPANFFKDSTPTLPEYSRVTSWAVSRNTQYLPKAINEFLEADRADAFIVGYVLADVANRTIVTYEVSAPMSKNNIKIPDVCTAHSIPYVNTIEMLRQLGETF